MSKELKMIGFGALTWVIPFLVMRLVNVSAPLMLVITILTICAMLVLYFQSIKKASFSESVVTGLLWLVINVVLDLLVMVINRNRFSLDAYIMNKFMAHLCIPIISMALGMNKK